MAMRDALILAKAKAEIARQRANDYVELSHQAETDYTEANFEVEKLEAQIAQMRKQEFQ